ncbi:hypothetical protein H9L14_13510 [Sphingomonas sediminicola]|uniref:Uncharacterized protein n=1 Tax=Sphingomonas sediminicola TaxID=386874 RepID=A0ABX6T6Q7_9SPHN|nr:hypothetical protein [Sphingomonas sediminicola]QNP45551.1 hypothetical protein H9L14_13510 [Sphingomonas sediminicola]
MLFYFPAEIELTDLRDALERYASFLDESPLESASSIQISMLGWKGYDRYELRSRGGWTPYVIFDRLHDLNNKPLNEWVPRLSSALSDNHVDEKHRTGDWLGPNGNRDTSPR